MIKKITPIVLTFVFLILFFIAWDSSFPFKKKYFGQVETVNTVGTISKNDNLKVLTYNIHFGIGLSTHREKIEKKDLLNHLNNIVKILDKTKADIVLLQEVDFATKRTAYIDQALYLAKRANYPYVAKASLLKKKIYPTHSGLGKIDYGLCVLSKLPIEKNEVTIFNYPKEMPFYLKGLYPPHGMQKIEIKNGEKTLNLINVHLEPFSQSAKKIQLNEILKSITSINSFLVVGGDFNMIPSFSKQKNRAHLDDAPWFIKKTNQKPKSLMSKIYALNDLKEAFSPPYYIENEKDTFTFQSNNLQVKIDYLFAGKGLEIKDGFVYSQANGASDHLPLFVKITSQL